MQLAKNAAPSYRFCIHLALRLSLRFARGFHRQVFGPNMRFNPDGFAAG
jgi:hypothetical protein